MLRGPADADHYRVRVGRYHDRWYVDPLPTCPLAEAAPDWQGPSVSTVKKGASGSDWSFVALKRVAQALHENPSAANLPVGELYDRLKSINQRGLERAGTRGTNIHTLFELGLRGRPIEPYSPTSPGAEYVDAVRQFFDQYQPELIACEVVAIHRTLNGVGYGGTFDAIVKIDGKTYLPDWKSRGEDSNHGAYPEEGAQVGGYSIADYFIVEGADGPERMKVPHLDGGLIVSVKPDGCRIYPVDLAQAAEHWMALHRWWVARQDEREAIGKPWAPRKTAAPAGMAGPSTVGGAGAVSSPAPPADPVRKVAGAIPMSQQFYDSLPGRPQLPHAPLDEGAPVDDATFEPLEQTFLTLLDKERLWVQQVITQASQAGVPFTANRSIGKRTVRRYELYRGLITLAAAGLGGGDDELIRGLVATVLDSDAPYMPIFTVGHCVGSLDAHRAATFAQECVIAAASPELLDLRSRPVAV